MEKELQVMADPQPKKHPARIIFPIRISQVLVRPVLELEGERLFFWGSGSAHTSVGLVGLLTGLSGLLMGLGGLLILFGLVRLFFCRQLGAPKSCTILKL